MNARKRKPKPKAPKKRGPGRPPMPEGEARIHRVALRLTEKERCEIEYVMFYSGHVSISETVRWMPELYQAAKAAVETGDTAGLRLLMAGGGASSAPPVDTCNAPGPLGFHDLRCNDARGHAGNHRSERGLWWE